MKPAFKTYWYDKRLDILAQEARDRIQEVTSLESTQLSSDYIHANFPQLRGALWWLNFYKGGTAKQEVKDLVFSFSASTKYPSRLDVTHQRIARIAGYWVPGRRPGVPNKPKPDPDPASTHQLNPSPVLPAVSDGYGNTPTTSSNLWSRSQPAPTINYKAIQSWAQSLDTLSNPDYTLSAVPTRELWDLVCKLLVSAGRHVGTRSALEHEVIKDTYLVLRELSEAYQGVDYE